MSGMNSANAYQFKGSVLLDMLEIDEMVERPGRILTQNAICDFGFEGLHYCCCCCCCCYVSFFAFWHCVPCSYSKYGYLNVTWHVECVF